MSRALGQKTRGTTQPQHGRKRLKDRARPTNNHLPRAPRAGSLAAQLEIARQAVDEAPRARRTDAAVETYRRERDAAKARLASKERERWADIDRAWERLKENDAAAQKGGRPRGKSISVGARLSESGLRQGMER